MVGNRCHGIARREFLLKVGALGSGLTLGRYLNLASAGEVRNPRAQAAILVFLKGGPSHQDTFDLKPEAPAEYRGEFRPIRTKVPGLDICEHLPLLAQCSDQYALIRGLSHNLADHGIGTTYVLTGNRPTPVLRYPGLGSVVSKELPAPAGVPPYVAIDEDTEGPGFLGTQYAALSTAEKPRPNQTFRVRGLALDEGLTIQRLEQRQRLAEEVDTAFRGYEDLDDPVVALHRFTREAHQIIRSPRSREAFDVTRERPEIAARFGAHETGLSLLLACRLIEAGVRFVTVVVDNWDTHNNNFTSLKNDLLPRFDRGLSALLRTLSERGLLDTTSVLVTGEFGRTPKVNGNAGRDHWARTMFALLAGPVRAGQVLGASDDRAAEPKGTAYTPDDLAATFYHTLGIDPRREYQANTGRPVMLVRDGQVIRDLV
jgi:hypothetical protein